MDNDTCTMQELVNATKTPLATIHRKLQLCGCAFETMANGKGRPVQHYALSNAFPEEWRLPLMLYRREQQQKASREEASSESQSNNGDASAERPEVNFTQEEIGEGLAAGRLAMLFKEHCRKSKAEWGQIGKVKKLFLDDYNRGEDGNYPELHKQLGHVALSTIEKWVATLKANKGDALSLVDRRGKYRNGKVSKGQITVTEEEQRILRSIALSPKEPLIAEVIRKARKRFEKEGLDVGEKSEQTYRRWLKDYKKQNYPEWVLFREGEKALNEKCLYHVRRDWSLIEVGEVVVADGHKLNWPILNPWTGKPHRMSWIPWYDMKSHYVLGWELMPEENTQSITSGFYRSCLTLGKHPKIPYLDNGKGFRAEFFTKTKDFEQEGFVGLFERLGCQPCFAWPYHGESKPVEGFFRVFAELGREMPGYSGTSIEAKPAYLRRNEKFHKELHEKALGGAIPTMYESHVAIAAWLDEYHKRPQDGNLKGRCPLDVFNEGKGPGFTPEEMVDLRLLMMHVVVRQIGRDGIKLPWSEDRYYHPDLYGRRLQSALVRYDWFDKGKVYVYDERNNFICEAEQVRKVHPMASRLGTKEDVDELTEQLRMKKRQEKETLGPARKFAEEHVLPELKKQMEDIGYEGGAVPVLPVKEVEEAKALKTRRSLLEKPMSEKEKRETLQGFEELQSIHASSAADEPAEEEAPEPPPEVVRDPLIWEELPRMRSMDRYEKLLELQAQRIELPMSEKTWMRYYEQQEEYRRHEDYFEQYKNKMTLMYQ